MGERELHPDSDDEAAMVGRSVYGIRPHRALTPEQLAIAVFAWLSFLAHRPGAGARPLRLPLRHGLD